MAFLQRFVSQQLLFLFSNIWIQCRFDGLCLLSNRCLFEGSSFDKNSRNYLNGIEDNLQKIKTLYGDTWIMRLYHDISEDSKSAGKICEIACKNSQIELCNVKNQKSNNNIQIAGNNQDGEQQIHRIYPLIWRFLPILDPNVDILLSRDLDSTITSREVEAVKQFLNSSKDFHIMRDHPNHIQPIMGGLWGIKLADPEMRKTYQTLFQGPNHLLL